MLQHVKTSKLATLAAVAAFLALALLIIGCGDDESEATPQPAPTAAPAATPAPTPAPTAAPTPTMAPTAAPQPTATPRATPRPTPAPTATPTPTPTAVMMPEPVESRLKVAINVPQYGENLEASIHNSIGGFLLPNAESLVGSDHVTGEFYPMLSSGWDLSNNAMTWTINLRQNVPWHGGNGSFSSADVIHSLERAVNPEVSSFSYISRFPQLDGTPGSIVQDIEATDDHSVKFEIDFPYVRLFKALAGSEGLFMTSKTHFDNVGADGYSTDPVGTGPYEFREFRSAEYSLWEAVDYDHYRVNPDFPELQLIFADEEVTRFAMLQAREAHTTVVGEDLTRQAAQEGLTVIQTTLPAYHLNIFFGGNFIPGTEMVDGGSAIDEDLPWFGTSENAIKIRTALSKAIDRDALNTAFYGGRGEPVITSLFHPGLGPWRDDWFSRYEDIHAYDPEGAKQLLAEAGYPDGFSGYEWAAFEIDVAPETNLLPEAVLAEWAKIGVNLDIFQTQRGAWVGNHRQKNTKGYVYSWHSTWQPIESRFEIYAYSKGFAACCSTEEFDRLFEDLISEPDLDVYDEKLRVIGDAILDTVFFLPLFWVYTDIIINPDVIAEYQTAGIWQAHDWEYMKAVKK